MNIEYLILNLSRIFDENHSKLQQGTGNREQGTGVKVSSHKALLPKFVPHLPEICCISITVEM